jgi:phenylacetate-CoA ligase
VEEIVRRQAEIDEFVIELRSVRSMEEVEILFEAAGEADGLAERLAADLRQALGARIDCRLVPPGTLPRSELKSKRLRRVLVD